MSDNDFIINGTTLVKYTGHDRIVRVPDGVTEISDGSFEGCLDVEEIIFPDSVESIWDLDLYGNNSLKRVTLSKNLKSIGDCTFMDCKKLEGLTLPDSLESIGDHAFADCSALKQIRIPKNVFHIGANTFSNSSVEILVDEDNPYFSSNGPFLYDKARKKLLACSLKDVEEVTVPDGIEEIGKRAFKRVETLKHVTLPDGLKTICTSAFRNTCLEEIVLTDSVERIENAAFSHCFSLSKVTLSRNLKFLGAAAFQITSLKKLILPKNVSEIQFPFTDRDVEIEIDEENPYILLDNGMLFNKSRTKLLGCVNERIKDRELVIPNGVEEIGAGAIEWCLAECILLSDSVKRIMRPMDWAEMRDMSNAEDEDEQ